MYNEKNIITYGLEDIDSVAATLDTLRAHCQVYAFTGSLGAGKTTLVRHLLARVGIPGPVTSPTFTYMHTYRNAQGKTFYHFDLYRLKTLDDFMHAGFDEYLYVPDSWAFIEWPEIIMPLLKKQLCVCEIEYAGAEKRVLRYRCID